jgi:uncharacterized membrane protein required for colicin V production
VSDWINWLLAGYLLLGALYGLRRGLFGVLFSLAGYLVGIMLASHWRNAATQWLTTVLPLRRWVAEWVAKVPMPNASLYHDAWQFAHHLLELLVFLAIIALTEWAGRLVGHLVTRAFNVFRPARVVNQLGGLVAGALEHGMVAGLVLAVLMTVPAFRHSPLPPIIERSPLADLFLGWIGHLAQLPGRPI